VHRDIPVTAPYPLAMITSATLPPPQSRSTLAGRPLVVASDPRRGARPIPPRAHTVRR